MLQVRNVPDDVHQQLRQRARQVGLSLSDFMLQELTAVVRRPSMGELMDRISSQASDCVTLSEAREAVVTSRPE